MSFSSIDRVVRVLVLIVLIGCLEDSHGDTADLALVLDRETVDHLLAIGQPCKIHPEHMLLVAAIAVHEFLEALGTAGDILIGAVEHILTAHFAATWHHPHQTNRSSSRPEVRVEPALLLDHRPDESGPQAVPLGVGLDALVVPLLRWQVLVDLADHRGEHLVPVLLDQLVPFDPAQHNDEDDGETRHDDVDDTLAIRTHFGRSISGHIWPS